MDERKESKMQLCAGSLVDRSRAFLGLCFACFLSSSLSLPKVLFVPPDSTGVGAEGLSLSRTRSRAPESFLDRATPRLTAVPPYLSVLLFPLLNQLVITSQWPDKKADSENVARMTVSNAEMVLELGGPGPTGRNRIRANIRQ